MKIIFDNGEQYYNFIDKICPEDFGFDRIDSNLCIRGAKGCAECLSRHMTIEINDQGEKPSV